ncbi:MAG TPA: PKD domain-containing protein, partial [Phaeodactylibacter sp.]|nr:PKD domain-containing protein [Phaeodactylibacter sp.]
MGLTHSNNFRYLQMARSAFALVLLFAFFSLMPTKARASHIVGGEITFECLGNNQYKIILDVYRDCFYGDPTAYFDNPAHIGIFNQSNILVQQVNMPFTGMDDTLSAIFSDPCLFDPGDVCVHTTRYEKVVTLPAIPGGYQLVYQRCCRNQTISNIYNPDQTGMTLSTYMSEQSMLECNNSPDFTFIPPIFICVNKPIDFDHSATDAEGDSLVYRLCTPYEGATYSNPYPPIPSAPPYDTVDWVDPPYNLDNILGTDSTVLSIDPHTGFITGVPTNQGQFVVGVCVEEYRNGQLISSMRRDFQYNVGQCGEATAAFFAPHAQCENFTVDFENQSSAYTSTYLWYFQYPDTTISSTEINPSYTYPDTGTYTIMLIADPGSVCADTFVNEIYLQHNSLFAEFDLQVFDCSDSSVLSLYDHSYDTISAPVAWNWTVAYDTVTLTSTEQNPIFYLPQPVTGIITMEVTSANNCVQSISRPFETGIDFPGAFIEDTLYICLGESVELNPQADTIGNLPYLWMPTDQVPDSTAANPVVSPTTTTTYTVHITSPGDFCTFTKTVTVVVEPLPALSFETYINCDAVTVDFTNTSQNASAYVWDFGDPSNPNDTSTEENPSYTYPAIGTY